MRRVGPKLSGEYIIDYRNIMILSVCWLANRQGCLVGRAVSLQCNNRERERERRHASSPPPGHLLFTLKHSKLGGRHARVN